MSDILFEVKKENLETGLRGYPVGYCTTSTVDPLKGLFYAGIPVSEIDHLEPEEVIYLLYHGRKGTQIDVDQFRSQLQKRAKCKEELVKSIEQLPRCGHPMKLFSASLLLAGIYESSGSYREDCLNLIAKAPEIAATVINHHAGWGKTRPSEPELGYIENFVHMLNIPTVDSSKLIHPFKLFSILHFDHGGGNLSAFVGKAVASGLEDLYGAMSAAMCALAGPKHGKANQDSLAFTQSLLQEIGNDASDEKLEVILRDKIAKHELIFGFGHAVLRVEDPRASLLYEVTKNLFPHHPLVKMAHQLRKVGTKILRENLKITDPYPNVDAISGVLLSCAGFPYPHYYTLLFGLARLVGIGRQIVYEREEARDGKGTPIVRPKYFFKMLEQV